LINKCIFDTYIYEDYHHFSGETRSHFRVFLSFLFFSASKSQKKNMWAESIKPTQKWKL